jgi:hypothetical protein
VLPRILAVPPGPRFVVRMPDRSIPAIAFKQWLLNQMDANDVFSVLRHGIGKTPFLYIRSGGTLSCI